LWKALFPLLWLQVCSRSGSSCFSWLSRPWLRQSDTGIEPFVSADDEFFRYIDERSSANCFTVLADLDAYIVEAGPFDGVMAFSEGAALAASLLIQRLQKNPGQQQLYPVFRCAVFFCAGVPRDLLRGPSVETRLMDFEQDGELIEIPTAHIWGENDRLYPSFGPVLCRLCKEDSRAVYVHKGGHEIPGPKDAFAVDHSVRVIKRAIERSMTAQ